VEGHGLVVWEIELRVVLSVWIWNAGLDVGLGLEEFPRSWIELVDSVKQG